MSDSDWFSVGTYTIRMRALGDETDSVNRFLESSLSTDYAEYTIVETPGAIPTPLPPADDTNNGNEIPWLYIGIAIAAVGTIALISWMTYLAVARKRKYAQNAK